MEHPNTPLFNLSPSSSLMSFNKLIHLLLVPFVLPSDNTRAILHMFLAIQDIESA